MGGFGFGFGQMIAPRAGGSGGAPPFVSFNEPVEAGADWSGLAGSGFAALPQDPVRSTAKPALRLLTPPNQYFSDSLTVGVIAAANDGGSLLGNLGLQHVYVHFEGTAAQMRFGIQSFADANGAPVSYLGWWATLQRPAGKSGHAHVYFEAVPRDSSMQNRVMGPYQFSPVEPFAATGTVHDFELEVAASPAEIPGVRYRTIKTAQSWLRNQGAQNPKITITETATYKLERYNNNYGGYSGAGYCTITASVPVTLGNTGEFVNNITAQARTYYDGIRFLGSNITFDMRVTDALNAEGGENGRQHWFDGITAINSGGHYYLWRGLPRTFGLGRFRPWYTECNISDIPSTVTSASLVRGCHLQGGYSDCATDADCVIGNRIQDWDSRPYIDEKPALTVQYVGAGASATLDLSGSNAAQSRTLTAKVDGATVGTFAITNTEAGWIANTNYTVQNVVDWLNSLPDWTATLINNAEAAGILSKQAGKGGAFFGLDVKTAPATLVTMYDLHADFWQLLEDYTYTLTARENRIIIDNVLTEFAGQKIFLSAGTVQAHDIMFINNAMHDMDDTGYQDEAILLSQLARSAHSHVVIAHNSMMQGVTLRTGNGYNPDRYCLIASNVFKSLFWSGTADPDLVMKDNHLFAGQSAPTYAIGTTIGGDQTSLFADMAAGDLTPEGALLASLKAPTVEYDAAGTLRPALSSVGSISQ